MSTSPSNDPFARIKLQAATTSNQELTRCLQQMIEVLESQNPDYREVRSQLLRATCLSYEVVRHLDAAGLSIGH